jgi:hypothetical protein
MSVQTMISANIKQLWKESYYINPWGDYPRDQGRNLKQPKQYKAPLVLYTGGGGWTVKDSIVLSPPRSTTRPDI